MGKRASCCFFLVAYCDVEDRLRQWQIRLSIILDAVASKQFEMLISQGRVMIERATTQARRIVFEQEKDPIVDVFTLNANSEVTEAGTLPLFPVVPRGDREQFFTSISQLTQWHKELITFLDKLMLSQDGGNGGEA